MTTKKIPFNYDINRMLAVDLIAIIHIDDYDTRFLELTLFDDGTPFSVEGCIVTSRFVTISGSYLLSDNVPCEATGNTITIPIDAAAVQMMACDIKIEVNIVDGEKILTLPFPLWVRVRGSILETAHVTPESQGTIPELLKEAAEELERVQGFVTSNDVYNILDHTLQGAQNVAPSLYVEPKGNNYALVYEDSEDVKHELFDFSNLPIGGTSDYQELENKPQINSHTLSGNQSSDDLGLQKKLTAGTNISIGNDGTISASGGTNDYQELENLPVIEGSAGSPRYSLTYGLNFNSAQFNISKIANDLIQVRLWNVTREIIDRGWAYFVGGEIQDLPEFHYRGIYDFNQLTITVEGETVNYKKAGYWIMQGINCRNIPQAFSDLVSDRTLLIVSHFAGYPIYEENKLFLYRTVYLLDSQNRVRIFSQYCKTFLHEAERVQNISDWQELNAGGSQIVSGVVNQNGTITFTDSDGQTFTTSGASVIGDDGFSPTATVTQTASGATVSITDKNGTTTANISNGADGQDYVLTSQDKTDIANIVLGELPTTQGVLYGNTSN